jgi:hypothetical protein
MTLRLAKKTPDGADASQQDFYFCTSCEVFGRGATCWWCGSSDLRWTFAPRPGELPATPQIDTSPWRSRWPPF